MRKHTPAAIKKRRRVIKYVLDIEGFGLKMKLEKSTESDMLEVTLFSDSDWAGDKDSRISVTRYCIFVMGCPIS